MKRIDLVQIIDQEAEVMQYLRHRPEREWTYDEQYQCLWIETNTITHLCLALKYPRLFLSAAA